jgi:hypothetical protein
MWGLYGAAESVRKPLVFNTDIRDAFMYLGGPQTHGDTIEIVPCYKAPFKTVFGIAILRTGPQFKCNSHACLPVFISTPNGSGDNGGCAYTVTAVTEGNRTALRP